MFFSRNKNILGLDIGTSFIKAVELKNTPDGTEIINYGVVKVAYPSGDNDKVDVLKATSNIISQLHDKARFSTRRAVVSLPANVAFVSVIDVPAMPEKELQKAVEFQAKRYIPLPLEEINLSWQILSQHEAGATEREEDTVNFLKRKKNVESKVLLTAVAKNVIANYLKVINDAGIVASALEIESLSQIRALIGEEDNGVLLVVDVGAKASGLTLVSNGQLWSSRHLNIGGDTFTENIARSMGITRSRAEQMKHEPPRATPSPIVSVARPMVDSIISEARQLARVMFNQGKKIEKVMLSGGGSALPSLAESLRQIAPDVVYGNPLKKVVYQPVYAEKLKNAQQQLTVAIGLALRGINR